MASPALLLDDDDNVAVALRELCAGEFLEFGDRAIQVGEVIRSGHKVALMPITVGGPIIKYGEVIGRATAPIEPGRHVHVHNLVSARISGIELSERRA
jgi:hypothetical protein